jgi:hypothetical protein
MELFRSSRVPLVNSKEPRDVRLSHVKPEYHGDRVTLHVLEADKGVACHSGAEEAKEAVLDAHKSRESVFIFGVAPDGSPSQSRLWRKHRNPEANEELISYKLDEVLSGFREDSPLVVFPERFLQVNASSVPASEFEIVSDTSGGVVQGWNTRPVLFQGGSPRLMLQDEIGNRPSLIPNIPELADHIPSMGSSSRETLTLNTVPRDPFHSDPSDQLDYPA